MDACLLCTTPSSRFVWSEKGICDRCVLSMPNTEIPESTLNKIWDEERWER